MRATLSATLMIEWMGMRPMILVIFILGLLLLCAGLLLLWRSTLKIRLDAKVNLPNWEVGLTFFWMNIELTHLRIDRAKFSQVRASSPDKWDRRLGQGLARLLADEPRNRKIHLDRLVWHTAIGTGDAFQTAMLCAALYNLRDALLPLFAPGQTQIAVVPIFYKKHFSLRVSCMMSLQAGEAMHIIRKIKKQLKGRKTDDGPSDSRINENGAGEPAIDGRCRDDHQRSD